MAQAPQGGAAAVFRRATGPIWSSVSRVYEPYLTSWSCFRARSSVFKKCLILFFPEKLSAPEAKEARLAIVDMVVG